MTWRVAAISVRVSAYIDGANLFHAGDSIGIRINYAKLKSLIATGRKIVDLKFYDATENTPAENHFFARIQTFGYTLKLVKLRRYGYLTPKEISDKRVLSNWSKNHTRQNETRKI